VKPLLSSAGEKGSTIMTTRTGTAIVQTEEHDGIFVITLDRPEARNAVDGATARAPTASVDRLESRDDLRVGILTGADGVFSAGMDLKAFAAGDTLVVEGRGLRRHPPRPDHDPAHRRRRGLCAGRRNRDGARVRHGRGRA
jgi:enoyl-CoA hydratase/carnithine racemase